MKYGREQIIVELYSQVSLALDSIALVIHIYFQPSTCESLCVSQQLKLTGKCA